MSRVILVGRKGKLLQYRGEKVHRKRLVPLGISPELSMCGQRQVPIGEDRAHVVWTLGEGGNLFVSGSTMTPIWVPYFERGICSHHGGAGEDKSCLTSLNSSATLKLQKRGWR